MRRRWTSLVLVVLGALLAVGIMASSAFAGTVPVDTPDPDTPGGGGVVVSDPGRLATTGSDDTPSLVLAGLAALAVGGVIVVAARRRREVLQRT